VTNSIIICCKCFLNMNNNWKNSRHEWRKKIDKKQLKDFCNNQQTKKEERFTRKTQWNDLAVNQFQRNSDWKIPNVWENKHRLLISNRNCFSIGNIVYFIFRTKKRFRNIKTARIEKSKNHQIGRWLDERLFNFSSKLTSGF